MPTNSFSRGSHPSVQANKTMASTGFKSISQVAEILDRPEIDGTARHFILELLTKTLSENIHLKSTIDTKNQEMCDLHIDNRGYEDQVEIMEKAIESFKDRVRTKDEEILKFMKNEKCYKHQIKSLENQLKEKDEEIGQEQCYKHQIESLEKQLKEKDEEIGQKTMELRQHSWRSNKMIYELQDKLDELQDELDETVEEREELRKEWKLAKGYT